MYPDTTRRNTNRILIGPFDEKLTSLTANVTMCQVAIDLEAVKSHDYYGESERWKDAVLPSRTTQMDGKTFPPPAQGILMKPKGVRVNTEADVKYARRPIVDISYAIENCSKLYSLRTCLSPSSRTLGYANSGEFTTSILDCVFRVISYFL
ncbi:hypothetical protein ALC62_01109 [Cyphomyrmex costatus]|uniref:Uncharacterized protein n=1 Tax=Cyphomyrmex costatus TaxID=456900 RepID=A0A195D4X8_9HYME|nr:hypothetical protein ALC62_01109 [Cyphomyrmex costatus]